MENRFNADTPNSGSVGRILSLADRDVIVRCLDLLADNSMDYVKRVRMVIDRQMGCQHSTPLTASYTDFIKKNKVEGLKGFAKESMRVSDRIVAAIRFNAAKDGILVWMQADQASFVKGVVREVVMLAAMWHGSVPNRSIHAQSKVWFVGDDAECLRVYEEFGKTLDRL